jgi:hypothetical protein
MSITAESLHNGKSRESILGTPGWVDEEAKWQITITWV